MPQHRMQLQAYGHPLANTAGLRSRTAKIPGLLARARRAKPPQQVPQQIPTIPRRRRKVPILQTSNAREILGLLQAYARGRRTVVITYKKATAGNELVTREIEPYSLRYKVSKKRGRARYLYAFCSKHQTIHCFLVGNITAVQGTSRSFTPRWQIEL